MSLGFQMLPKMCLQRVGQWTHERIGLRQNASVELDGKTERQSDVPPGSQMLPIGTQLGKFSICLDIARDVKGFTDSSASSPLRNC